MVDSKLTYLNNYPAKDCTLKVGDKLFAMGFILIVGPDFIIINNPNNRVTYNNSILMEYTGSISLPENTTELDDDTWQETF